MSTMSLSVFLQSLEGVVECAEIAVDGVERALMAATRGTNERLKVDKQNGPSPKANMHARERVFCHCDDSCSALFEL